jgi:predicted Zn-dependent protease with MMP-like domain
MIHLSDREFDLAVAAALRSIPPEFQEYMDNVVVEVRDHPDRGLMREHDVPDDILGLYVGCPLEDRGVEGPPLLPDRIYVFRRNLVEMC